MRSPKQRKLKMVSLRKSALLAKTFVFGLVLLVLPIVCAANNPPTVWLFNQSDSNVALNSSINIRISAADYDDAEIEIHLDRQRPDGVWEDLANYRVSGNPRAPEKANQAADWDREYSTLLDRAGTWTIRLTAFDFPDGQKRQGNTETFTTTVSAPEGNLSTLVWIAALLLLAHLLLAEISRLFNRRMDSDAATISGLLVFGLICYVSFWVYYFNRWLGAAFSIGVAGAFVLSVGRHLYSERNLAGYIQSAKLLLPVTSTALVLLFIGLYPFAAGWDELKLPAHRWLDMPIDNVIPKLFADQIWAGEVKHPMILDWLSSDRPPLQTGLYLLFKPLAPNVPGVYQVISTWAQCTILIPLILIMRSTGVLRGTGTLALLVISCCPSMVVNGLFVWPKLLAGAFTTVYYLGLFPPQDLKIGNRERVFWGAGGAALTLLSHGGAVFAVAGIAVAYLCLKRGRDIGVLVRSAAFGAICYLPWVLYQKLVDPPGDRLLSYHLAGEKLPNGRPFLEVLRGVYSHLSLSQWWDARVANINAIFHGSVAFFRDMAIVVSNGLHGQYDPKTIVVDPFFYVGYSLGFFTGAVAIAAFVAGLLLRNRSLQFSLKPLFWSLSFTAILWAIAMFNAGSTIVHQGSYFLALGALVLSMALVRACGTVVFNLLCVLNLSLFVVGYVFDRELTYPRLPGFNFDPLYIVGAIAVLAIHFFACQSAIRSPSDAAKQDNSESAARRSATSLIS